MASMNRRTFTKAAVGLAAAGLLNSTMARGQASSPVPAPADYSAVRGFNYMPSYGATLQYIWTAFDRAAWEREVPWSKRFGTNMLRIWLDWQAWLAIGDGMLDALGQALDVADKNGIRLMPVLFNRWNDARTPLGGVSERDLMDGPQDKFFPYVDALMGRFGADARVAAWDLCNEPQAPWNRFAEVNAREVEWLKQVAERVRLGSRTPITVGTMGGPNVEAFAPIADVLSFHPYMREIGKMEEACKAHLAIAQALAKPLLCTEACCGSLDDQERGRQARDDIETLERNKIGWMVWQLCEGRFVTGNRQRTDDNALHPGQGYMPFVLADGTTRPGHEWLERQP